jgi:HEPN domain-containing protein
MAEGYLRMAEIRLAAAKNAQNQKGHAFAVRLCQETVELSLKAALRLIAIEPPHWHDVGPIIKEHIGKFPVKFQENIAKLVSISRSLRLEREVSMYGDEEVNIPPDQMYTKVDSERSVSEAEFVFQLCKELLAGMPSV